MSNTNNERKSVEAPSRFELEFLPDAAEIEHKPIPFFNRIVLYLIILMIGVAIAWAAISEIDKVVVAEGKLITTTPKIFVQPISTSIVLDIHVQVGQLVKKGDPLAELDPTFTDASLSQVSLQLENLTAEIERLNSEMNETPYAPDPTEMSEYQRTQKQIYDGRMQEYTAKLAELEAGIDQAKAAIYTNTEEQKKLKKRLKISKEIEEMYLKMFEKKAGSKLNLLQTRDERLKLEESLTNLINSKKELIHSRQAALSQKAAYVNEWRSAIGQQLNNAREERISLNEQLTKAERLSNLVILTAPRDAIVLEVAEKTIGSVVREAETIISMTPIDVPLEAEVMIPAKNIGLVSPEDETRVKLEAFPFQKHGTLTGKVRTISEDAFQIGEDNPQTVYKSRVVLDKPKLKGVSERFRLIPGMNVVAEIKVGTRTVLSYFLYPIIKGLDESINEP